MKAIVLTYDRNRSLTEHMVRRYRMAWADHPFRFRVPFQSLGTPPAGGAVEMIESPSNIKATVLRLIEDLPDDEMIYWCIDDKYPIALDLTALRSMHAWITGPASAGFDGLLFCQRLTGSTRPLGRRAGPTLGDGLETVERTDYRRIWIHQYLRVKVIRTMFLAFPDDLKSAKRMDELKDQLAKPADHRLLVTRAGFATFGESSSRGLLTTSCRDSMNELGVPLPAWATSFAEGNFIMGDAEAERPKRLKDRLRRMLGTLRHRLLPG